MMFSGDGIGDERPRRVARRNTGAMTQMMGPASPSPQAQVSEMTHAMGPPVEMPSPRANVAEWTQGMGPVSPIPDVGHASQQVNTMTSAMGPASPAPDAMRASQNVNAMISGMGPGQIPNPFQPQAAAWTQQMNQPHPFMQILQQMGSRFGQQPQRGGAAQQMPGQSFQMGPLLQLLQMLFSRR